MNWFQKGSLFLSTDYVENSNGSLTLDSWLKCTATNLTQYNWKHRTTLFFVHQSRMLVYKQTEKELSDPKIFSISYFYLMTMKFYVTSRSPFSLRLNKSMEADSLFLEANSKVTSIRIITFTILWNFSVWIGSFLSSRLLFMFWDLGLWDICSLEGRRGIWRICLASPLPSHLFKKESQLGVFPVYTL